MNRFETMEEKKNRLELELEQLKSQMNAASVDIVPRMLTIREAAKEVGLSYNYIRSLCLSGRIVSIRVGNRIMVNREKLIAFLNSGKEETYDS